MSRVCMPEGEEPLQKTGFEEEQGVYVAPEWEGKGTPAHTQGDATGEKAQKTNVNWHSSVHTANASPCLSPQPP